LAWTEAGSEPSARVRLPSICQAARPRRQAHRPESRRGLHRLHRGCILDPAARQVCTACDIMFDEAHGWDWTATTGASPAANFTVEYIYTGASGAAATARPASPYALSSPTPSVRTPVAPPSTPVAMPSPQSGAASVAGPVAPPLEFVTPLENDEERLDAAHGELLVRYRAYDNIIGTREHVPGLAARNLIKELNLMSTRSCAPSLKLSRTRRGKPRCRRRLTPSSGIKPGN
jgi:hypothetical protein